MASQIILAILMFKFNDIRITPFLIISTEVLFQSREHCRYINCFQYFAAVNIDWETWVNEETYCISAGIWAINRIYIISYFESGGTLSLSTRFWSPTISNYLC